ncbi:MAG: DEAD/DEAH box helicase [Verrucomicrobiales bacterium]
MGASHRQDADATFRPTANHQQPITLLIVPASLIGNWRAEFARFAPDLRVLYAHPSQIAREAVDALKSAGGAEAAAAGRDAVVTTYSMLARLEGLRAIRWRLAVLDEAQAIKNAGTAQSKLVRQLDAEVRLALTGTPVENRAGDLWSLFDFLNPGLLGTASNFGQVVKSLNRDGGPGYAPLRRLVSPYILRRMKTDKAIIADLPDKVELRAECGLSKRQATLYQKSVQELAAVLRETQVDGIQRRGLVLTYLMRFKQICDHPSLWTGSGEYAEKDSGKFRRLAEICDEVRSRGEKALVFTQFREMTGPLTGFLEGIFGRPGIALHGGTPVKRRQKLVDQFQSDAGPPFFVISLKAGGTGLNLTAASHVIHFDRWWNPAVENQATDRAFRIGQKRNVLVHKFVCRGTIEERIDAMIAEKKDLAEELLGGEGAEKMLTEMGDDELLQFVALDLNAAAF